MSALIPRTLRSTQTIKDFAAKVAGAFPYVPLLGLIMFLVLLPGRAVVWQKRGAAAAAEVVVTSGSFAHHISRKDQRLIFVPHVRGPLWDFYLPLYVPQDRDMREEDVIHQPPWNI